MNLMESDFIETVTKVAGALTPIVLRYLSSPIHSFVNEVVDALTPDGRAHHRCH